VRYVERLRQRPADPGDLNEGPDIIDRASGEEEWDE
jgi:hypothetical protein